MKTDQTSDATSEMPAGTARQVRTRILETIARLSCTRYKLVLLVAFLLTIASWMPPMFIGMRFAFSIARMLPQDIPAARAFTRAVVDFDSADEAVVVFHLAEPTEAAVKIAGETAEKIVKEVSSDPMVITAYCRKFTPEEKDYLINKELPRRGMLLLSEKSLEQVAEKLKPGAIRRSVRKTARRMESGIASDSVEELAAYDSLGLGGIFQSAIKSVGSGVKKGGGYIVDKNRKMLLLIIQPRQPAQRVEFAEAIMEKIQAATEKVVADLPPAARKMFKIEYGGGYEIARRYTSRVNDTLISTLLTSLIGVILLFGYCFRRYGVLLYIGLPLVMIVSWTIGLGWIIFGQLNIVSCAFAAVLVGLGVDYAIHIYNRYVEERSKGESVEVSFRESLVHTGWGVFIGMVTTSLAFLALKATRFNQLSQFGALAGLGIALSVPGMLFVLPALIAWRNARKPEHARTLCPTRFGLPSLANFVEKNRKVVLAIGTIAILACCYELAFRPQDLKFDERISSLRPRERAFELGGEIARAFSNRNPNKLLLLVHSETEEKVMEKTAQVAKDCEKLRDEGMLLDYESVMRYLPAPSEQRKRLEILKKIDFEKALEVFAEALDEEGLAEDSFTFSMDMLRQHGKLAKEGGIILPGDYKQTPVWRLMKRLVTRRREQYYLMDDVIPSDRFPITLAKPAVNREGNEEYPAGEKLTPDQVEAMRLKVKHITILGKGYSVKTNIYPPIDEKSKTADLRIDDEWLATIHKRLGIANGDEGEVFLTGMSVLVHELAGVVKEDFFNLSVVVFAVAVLVLAAFFHRHPLRTLYCLLPIVSGLLFLFGLMCFFQIPFNFINVLAVPIIIGLGVDNGIHLVNRFYESGRRIAPMISDTGRAIMVTTLTSMIGFGSLAVGGYRGITSMGVLSILALGSSVVASLIFFPAILATFSPPSEIPQDPEKDQD